MTRRVVDQPADAELIRHQGAGGPCLVCRRPLTMTTQLETDGQLTGRKLYVCLGHPPNVHRTIRRAVTAAERAGFTRSDRFGTFRCPSCQTSSTIGELHVPGSDECELVAHERDAMMAGD